MKNKGYEVDILVNNAGYGIPTSFHETSMEEEEKFIRVLGYLSHSNDKNFSLRND